MAWNDLTTTIRIPGAQFVGAVKDGGVVIETHDIEYREGRVPGSSRLKMNCSRALPDAWK